MKLWLLGVIAVLLLGMACGQENDITPIPPTPTPSLQATSTPLPTPAGPALSVDEYTKACYAAYEKTLNSSGRYATREQWGQHIADLRELTPPRSLEKFHFAFLSALEATVREGPAFALSKWMEADAQIGQIDAETYAKFEQRGLCGFDELAF